MRQCFGEVLDEPLSYKRNPMALPDIQEKYFFPCANSRHREWRSPLYASNVRVYRGSEGCCDVGIRWMRLTAMGGRT
jgi:hypothetical protein